MKKNLILRILLGVLATGLMTPEAFAAPACSVRSPAKRIALLELYTSEGCSSCPPADHWLNGLRQKPKWVGKMVPLALHVDYWDSLGWKDAFAKPSFSTRQQQLVSAAGSTVVYTPQFFLQGKTWGSNPKGLDDATLQRVNALPAGADIELKVDAMDKNTLPVHVTAKLRPGKQSADVYVVLYENGLSTAVRAGENKGANLRHDYVVREWIGPKTLTQAKAFAETIRLTIPKGASAASLGVAVFVQDPRNREVLQAISSASCS